MSTTDDLDALLSPVIEQAMHEMRVPGALVHVRVGRCTRAAQGVRQSGSSARPTPMTVHDHVRIGSNTKTMTGTVVLKLVDQEPARPRRPG